METKTATYPELERRSHIPGPWITQHSGTGDARVIAKPGWRNRDGSEFNPVIVSRIDWETASLIAAAPDLLIERDALRQQNARLVEALRDTVRCLTMDSDMEEDFAHEIKQARAALALAQGKS